MQVMQGGVRHCCRRHHEGHPRMMGRGQQCLPVRGGGGLQQQLGTIPFNGPVCAPAPLFGGGGGGPKGPGVAVLRGAATGGPQRRAHNMRRTPFRRAATHHGARAGIGQAIGRL